MKSRRLRAAFGALSALVFVGEAHGADGGEAALRAKAESAAKRLRRWAAKAEAELPAARAKVDEMRPKVEAARPAAQAKADACLAKIDADEAEWKTRLGRCDEKAAEARAVREVKATAARAACEERAVLLKQKCQGDCMAAMETCTAQLERRKRPGDGYACVLQSGACIARCVFDCDGSAALVTDPCTGLRAQGDAFKLRRERCREPLNDAERPLREAWGRLGALEGEIRSKRDRADLVEKQWRTLPADRLDDLVWGRVAPFVAIPAGKVRLGRTGKTVDVAPFLLDRTEVTVAAYSECVKAGTCTPPGSLDSCNTGVLGRENHPINCVGWTQAQIYCKAQGLRLPTEEEWEYAATGGDGRAFPWGNEPPTNQLCWGGEGNDQGRGNRHSTCPVGSYPRGRSPLGVDDMSGNAAEWTATRDGESRVILGGGWGDVDPSHVRSAARHVGVPAFQIENLGFRCAGSASLP